MKDGISVIVAVYNVREHLSRCIESLLSQNCKNYEIIIVDDGSTDGSGDILDGYFRENPEKIRLVRQQNAGLSAARNVGLSLAVGEYVTFVDGDDYLEKNEFSDIFSITILKQQLKTKPTASVVGLIMKSKVLN